MGGLAIGYVIGRHSLVCVCVYVLAALLCIEHRDARHLRRIRCSLRRTGFRVCTRARCAQQVHMLVHRHSASRCSTFARGLSPLLRRLVESRRCATAATAVTGVNAVACVEAYRSSSSACWLILHTLCPHTRAFGSISSLNANLAY